MELWFSKLEALKIEEKKVLLTETYYEYSILPLYRLHRTKKKYEGKMEYLRCYITICFLIQKYLTTSQAKKETHKYNGFYS
jgi:hypothetical protein